MSNRNSVLLLVLVALVGIVGLLVFLNNDSGRADRYSDTRETGLDEGPGPDSDSSAGALGRTADEAQLADLIARYGGSASTGVVFLTRPDMAGEGLHAVLSRDVDGVRVEAKAAADAEGKITFRVLPRLEGYTLTITGGKATRPYAAEQIALRPEAGAETEAVDLGTHRVDRWYFVRGKVVGRGALGVKGAKVRLVAPAGGGRSFSWMDMTENAARPDPSLAETETDAGGRFEFKMKDPGRLALTASAKGWARHYRPDVVVGANLDRSYTLALTRGYEVSGYVLDGNGSPVGGVDVSIVTFNFRDFSFPKELSKTDGAGRFTFRLEPSAQEYTLNVMPRDAAIVNKRFRVPLEEELIIRLPGGVSLVGRIVDADTRQPIPNANILVGISLGQGGWMPDMSQFLRTDEYGRYRIDGIEPGKIHSVAITAEGYATFSANQWMPTDRKVAEEIQKVKIKTDGETKLPDIPLKRGNTVRGKVTDSVNERPLAGARVLVWDMSAGTTEVRTASDGSYLVSNIGDRVNMTVRAQGYADSRDGWMGTQLVVENGHAERNFALVPGASVEGRVLTEDKRPVKNALVRVKPRTSGRGGWGQSMSTQDLWTHSDSEGRFRIAGVPKFKIYVEAQATGFDLGESKDFEPEPGERKKDLDVILQLAASLSGRILSADGGPVGSARITVAKDPGPDADRRAEWRALSQGVTGFSGEQGEFVVAEVFIGNILVRVEADQFATLTTRIPSVKPGQQIKNRKLVLRPAKTISGKVVDEKGEPYTRAWISAKHTASPDGEPVDQLLGARLESDGTFIIRNIPDGTYSIEIRISNWGGQNTAGYKNQTVENVAAGTKGLEIKLRKQAQ